MSVWILRILFLGMSTAGGYAVSQMRPELIENGMSGLLVNPRDPQALANGIGRLFSNPELRMRLGENGRDRVLKKFTTDAIVPRWEKFYQEMWAKTTD